MKPLPYISQEELKEFAHYDPEAGVFTRKHTTSWRSKKGDVIGRYGPKTHYYIKYEGNIYQGRVLAWL